MRGTATPSLTCFFTFCLTWDVTLRPRKKSTHAPAIPPLFSHEEWSEIIRHTGLSPRQAEILSLLMQSRKDKEIAAALDIKHSTVRSHIGETKERLAAADRVGLAYRVFWTFRRFVEPQHSPRN